MYEYVIYVARAEDINLFCGEREEEEEEGWWAGGGGGGGEDKSADVPLLIGWLNSVCSL